MLRTSSRPFPGDRVKLMILRHAPAVTGGRLAGRRDVVADCSDDAAFDWIRTRIADIGCTVTSPAIRCRQTASKLGHGAAPSDPRLWEQDHGDWEGRAYDALPDLGQLTTEALAQHRPPSGESFNDMTARVIPALQDLTSDTLVVAHAGTVRAALAMVIGAQALSFVVTPLSLTTLHRAGTSWAVESVNLTAR